MGQALEQKNLVLHNSPQKSASVFLYSCVDSKDTGFTGVLACVPKWQTQPEKEGENIRRPQGKDMRNTLFRPQGATNEDWSRTRQGQSVKFPRKLCKYERKRTNRFQFPRENM